MGFFGDLAMGLGLKDRDASYYDRTAKTIGRNDGAAAEARYRQGRAYTEQPTRGGPVAMLGAGGRGGRRQWLSEEGVPEDTGKWGYGEGDSRVSALRDMLDGGGRGRAGQRFEGGLLADLANALGIRPMGYEERLAAARPMARPTRPAAAPNWAGAQKGIALEGQAPRFGTAALSFGADTAMPDDMGLGRPSPLAFGSPRPPLSVSPRDRRDLAFGFPRMGNWGSPINMSWTGPYGPTQPMAQENLGTPISTGGAITTLPANAMSVFLDGLHRLGTASPSYGNIRGTGTGTGTGGGGYGFPVVGTYTF